MEKRNLPSIADIRSGELSVNLVKSQFVELTNATPPESWLKKHPQVKAQYIPIERVEWLLRQIFLDDWRVEIKDVKLIANSVVTTVRLHFKPPHKDEWTYQDGVGASPLQTNAGAGATDFNALKNASVQMAAPASESYAIKDAAEKIGRLFGADINRAEQISMEGFSKQNDPDAQLAEIMALLAEKETLLTPENLKGIQKIIADKDTAQYKKVLKHLKTLKHE